MLRRYLLACFILSLAAISLFAQPRLHVEPDAIDGGVLRAGAEADFELIIANMGDETLAFQLAHNEEEFNWLSYEPDAGELEPDDEIIITITVTAPDFIFGGGEYEGALLIAINDPENELVIVEVFFWVQPIEIFPEEIEFNDTYITRESRESFVVGNPFEGEFIIEAVEIEEEDNFSFITDLDDGILIEFGEEVELEVAFLPQEADDYQSEFRFHCELRVNIDGEDMIVNGFVETLLIGRGILPPGPPWELFPECDAVHAIIVNDVTFNGEEIDLWYVGLFDTIDLDVRICSGYDLWRGERIGLNAYPDDPETEPDEGFEAGQRFYFRLWDPFEEVEYRNVEIEFIQGLEGWVRDALTILTLSCTDEPLPPNLVFNHAELDFPDTYITQQSVQIVVADNWGEETVVISEFELDNDANFSILLQDSVEIVIDPNEELEFEIAFHPQDTGGYEGIVTFETNVENENDGVFELLLSGIGVDSLNSVHSGRPRYPDTPTLHPPAPNPFNSQTRISYHIPVETHLDLALYDISGREVMTLFSGVRPAGVWSTTIDANELTSGLYLLRMNANSQVLIQKLICIK